MCESVLLSIFHFAFSQNDLSNEKFVCRISISNSRHDGSIIPTKDFHLYGNAGAVQRKRIWMMSTINRPIDRCISFHLFSFRFVLWVWSENVQSLTIFFDSILISRKDYFACFELADLFSWRTAYCFVIGAAALVWHFKPTQTLQNQLKSLCGKSISHFIHRICFLV